MVEPIDGSCLWGALYGRNCVSSFTFERCVTLVTMQLLHLCQDDFMKLRHRWPVVTPGDLAASWFSSELTGEQEPAEGIIYRTWPRDASETPQEALKESCGPGDVWSSHIRVVQLPPSTCMMQECSSNDVTPDRGFMLYNINKPMATFLSGVCGEGRRTMDGD